MDTPKFRFEGMEVANIKLERRKKKQRKKFFPRESSIKKIDTNLWKVCLDGWNDEYATSEAQAIATLDLKQPVPEFVVSYKKNYEIALKFSTNLGGMQEVGLVWKSERGYILDMGNELSDPKPSLRDCQIIACKNLLGRKEFFPAKSVRLDTYVGWRAYK